MLLLVPVSYSIDVMQTRSQQHMEIATFFSTNPQTFIKNNDSFRNCLATLVLDKPMDSFVNLHKHAKERPPVFCPQARELPCTGEVTAAGINSDLRTVTKRNAEILHTSQVAVPFRATDHTPRNILIGLIWTAWLA